MSYFEFLSFAVSLIIILLSIYTREEVKGYIFVVGVTTFYYGVAGPWYWMDVNGGFFLGVDWSAVVWETSLLLSASILMLVSIIIFSARYELNLNSMRGLYDYKSGKFEFNIKDWRKVFYAGGFGCIYILINATILGKNHESGDPIFLIAYQFSDAFIPAVLYVVAHNFSVRKKIGYSMLFVGYALAVGFRYKLALFFGPVFIWVLLSAPYKYKSRGELLYFYIKMAVCGAMIPIFLGILTLVRRPFEGADLSVLSDSDSHDFLYGFFAETNTIFALATIKENFVPLEKYYNLIPIRDAFLELIPRFLYPDRRTGAYLADVLAGLLSDEALTSGTAYPFIGELLLMRGYFGLIVGLFLVAAWYVWCQSAILKFSNCISSRLMGYAILATYFGYYFFSRGYFAQSFKGFLFVVLPYIFIISKEKSLKND